MTEPPSTGARGWRHYGWPALIVALLLGHVVVVTGALVLSSTLIPAASVAPSGYAEALAWDEVQAARAESERLNWTLEVVTAPTAEVTGERELTLYLVDANGVAIRDADIRVRLFHHSQPSDVIESELSLLAGGDGYRAKLPLRREGQWRLSVWAIRGPDRFLAEADFWLASPQEADR